MRLKKKVLELMLLPELKAAIDALQIADVDRRSNLALRQALSRSRAAKVEVLLDEVPEARVKVICEQLRVSAKGRKAALIRRLLDGDGPTKPPAERHSQADAPAETPQPVSTTPAAKISVTKTELVWPGKYNEDGTLREVPRVSLPFQVIETVNESRAARDAKAAGTQPTLFDVYQGNEGDTFEDGWRNKLIWGDNLLVMGSLLEKFAGKIDLIYIDPPFATGADFSFSAQIGEDGASAFKEQSVIEEKAYRDTWGKGSDSFISMIYDRLVLMRDLLADDGSIYVHCDWKMNSLIRVILDEVFGRGNFRNELIWHYPGREMHISSKFNCKHDTILFYARSENTSISMESVTTPYDREERIRNLRRKVHEDEDGREWVWETRGQASGQKPYKRYIDEIVSQGRPVSDVWSDLQFLRGNHPERVDYPTQKPQALLERIINASSTDGALVADFFCGSGTTPSVAEKLGRRWIGCDLGRWGVHTTRKRLLGIENCRPFEVLNLGRYERQYWQGTSFAKSSTAPISETALYEYLAFILKLYGARPAPGLTHLHGQKNRAMVHIGAVDAPVTIGDVDAAVDECVKLRQKELHVLGWEWEMGLNDLMANTAKARGVKLLLLQIPREVMERQATEKGDVRFFELAYLKATVRTPRKRTACVKLEDFVIPNPELIPADARSKVKKWSDYIDYWAVDWDFQHDTFMQGWVTYRTRRDRSLALVSDPHTYPKAGRDRALVKVIDIFGNDTSQLVDLRVK